MAGLWIATLNMDGILCRNGTAEAGSKYSTVPLVRLLFIFTYSLFRLFGLRRHKCHTHPKYIADKQRLSETNGMVRALKAYTSMVLSQFSIADSHGKTTRFILNCQIFLDPVCPQNMTFFTIKLQTTINQCYITELLL